MVIITKANVIQFYETDSKAKEPLLKWYHETLVADWKDFAKAMCRASKIRMLEKKLGEVTASRDLWKAKHKALCAEKKSLASRWGTSTPLL
ncbi:hypothetical protein [Parasediminibacterium sp. JCM 36343]|uniref:hypothetical protein n=1 Tax=Parasediminibacterium sp. JCM 36343 TaxID=3374279 RepID=UPI0039783892